MGREYEGQSPKAKYRGAKYMKKEFRYLSYCGMYHCAFCDYHKGTIVKLARDLLTFVEKYGSLSLIADACNACNFGEFVKGLKWLSSHDEPCKGCRFGGGWSWWSDCPVRDCCIRKKVDFCYQCKDFPCRKLISEPMLDYKRTIIDANNQIKAMGAKKWTRVLKKKYT